MWLNLIIPFVYYLIIKPLLIFFIKLIKANYRKYKILINFLRYISISKSSIINLLLNYLIR